MGHFSKCILLLEKGVKSKIIGYLESRAVRVLDKVFMINQHDYKVFKTNKNVKLVPLPGLGVDTDLFNEKPLSQQRSSTLRDRLHIPPQHKVLLFVGRFTEFKGVNDAILVFKKLKDKHNDLTMLLCGLKDSLHPIDVQDHEGVIDLGWRQDLCEIMRISDCLLFPSIREGLPITLMQAIAVGLPYTGYDVRGVQDLQYAYKGGFVTSAKDVEAMAKQAEQIVYTEYSFENSTELTANLSHQHYVDYQLNAYEDFFQKKQHI